MSIGPLLPEGIDNVARFFTRTSRGNHVPDASSCHCRRQAIGYIIGRTRILLERRILPVFSCFFNRETGRLLPSSFSNACLAFEALTGRPFGYQCSLWGTYPQTMSYHACMKLSTSFAPGPSMSPGHNMVDVDSVDVMQQQLTTSVSQSEIKAH